MKLSFKGKGSGGGKAGGGFKALLLKHGEKIGMAVVGVCVAVFLYTAMGRERLPADKQHDVLLEKVDASERNIKNYTWQQAVESNVEGEEPNAVFAQEFDGSAVAPVPDDKYAIAGTGWDRPVVPPTVLRTDPVLLSVTDIEVHGWSALMPFTDAATIRKRRLEATRLAAEQKKKADKMAEDMARENERGGRGRGGEYAGPGAEMGYGPDGMIDPNNPNRRMMTAMVRPEGVPVQGDELVKIVYGATILAKVPVDDQKKLYRDALENAKGGFMPERDRPKYLAAFVERAEVTDSGKELQWTLVKIRSGTGKRPWSGVSSNSLADAVADWPMEMEEVADTRYVHPLLTFPLPPLVGQNWGDRAKLADVPLQADYNAEEEMKKQMEEQAPAEEGDEENLFGRPAPALGGEYGAGGMGRGGPRMPYGGGEGRMGYGGEGGMRMPYGGGSEYGGEGRMGYGGGYGGEGGMGMGGGMGVTRSFDAEEPLNQQPFWMFRFFDTSVEPGKRYKYRVQLALTDVNGYIQRSFLDREVIARLPAPPTTVAAASKAPPLLRRTEWSDPSPAVSIPMAGEVRIAQTTPASDRQSNSEPSVRLLVKSFDLDEAGKAIQAAIEEEFRRGSVMNLTRDAETVVGPYIDKIENFDFRTGATLLDIQGGEKTTGDLTAPSKVLIMDAGGRLSVRDELTDIGEVEQHRAIFAPPDPNQQNMGYGGEYGGEGGRGYRGN
ncbi:MAG: hypothetical protein WD851_09855 [Pirellulales bacterium]